MNRGHPFPVRPEIIWPVRASVSVDPWRLNEGYVRLDVYAIDLAGNAVTTSSWIQLDLDYPPQAPTGFRRLTFPIRRWF